MWFSGTAGLPYVHPVTQVLDKTLGACPLPHPIRPDLQKKIIREVEPLIPSLLAGRRGASLSLPCAMVHSGKGCLSPPCNSSLALCFFLSDNEFLRSSCTSVFWCLFRRAVGQPAPHGSTTPAADNCRAWGEPRTIQCVVFSKPSCFLRFCAFRVQVTRAHLCYCLYNARRVQLMFPKYTAETPRKRTPSHANIPQNPSNSHSPGCCCDKNGLLDFFWFFSSHLFEPNPRGPCAEPESKAHGRLATRGTWPAGLAGGLGMRPFTPGWRQGRLARSLTFLRAFVKQISHACCACDVWLRDTQCRPCKILQACAWIGTHHKPNARFGVLRRHKARRMFATPIQTGASCEDVAFGFGSFPAKCLLGLGPFRDLFPASSGPWVSSGLFWVSGPFPRLFWAWGFFGAFLSLWASSQPFLGLGPFLALFWVPARFGGGKCRR